MQIGMTLYCYLFHAQFQSQLAFMKLERDSDSRSTLTYLVIFRTLSPPRYGGYRQAFKYLSLECIQAQLKEHYLGTRVNIITYSSDVNDYRLLCLNESRNHLFNRVKLFSRLNKEHERQLQRS